MNYNRAVMKEEVKQTMRQTRPHPMLVTLLYLVIVGAGASLISWLMNTLFSGSNTLLNELMYNIQYYGEDYLEYVLENRPDMLVQLIAQSGTASFVVSILTTIWNGLMSVGYSGYCLDMSRSMNPPLERIFGGFSRAGSVILAYILVAVFTFLWSLLLGVGFVVVIFGLAFLAASIDSFALFFLLMLAAIVGYAIGIIWVVLRYAMVPFAIVDSQEPMSAMDAIRASKAIMKGRKGSYFVLQLSFIGWYLLEYLVVIVGVIIAVVAAAGSIGSFEYMFYYGDLDPIQLLTHMIGPVLIVALLCGAAIFILNLWLTPYRTGCNARFYLYATGGQPIYPGPYGGQPGPYGGQSGPYGGQPGPYGGQSGPYRSQPGPYGGQPGPYGGQPGPYNNNPYGYTPPSQGSFGGYTQPQQPPQYGAGTYTQTEQPPQYGVGTYTQPDQPPQYGAGTYTQPDQPPQYGADTYAQWGVPQAPKAPIGPESPAFSEPVIAPVFDEAPVEPAAPQVSVTPEPPAFPEAVIAPVFDEASAAPEFPAEPADDALYEAPYAEPEAPNDDMPQQPGGPNYPQY